MKCIKLITVTLLFSFFSIANAQFQPKQGIEYYYYDDNSGRDTDKEKGLTSDQYKFLCENTKGVTKHMSTVPGNGNSDYGYLIDNGNFDGWKVTYEPRFAKNKCRIEMTASGFIKGNSRRVTVRGSVSTFIISEEGLILAHWGLAW